MAKKGLDVTFVHYGIRKEDMQLIDALCLEHQLDANFIKDDILREYHDRRIRNQEMDEKAIAKLIDKALQKIQ